MQKQQQYYVQKSLLKNFFIWLNFWLNRFLVFFQLRQKRQFWGIIYDSMTKEPLDPVRVSLIYADTGKVESAAVTDLQGRYGFLARPGRFKIFPQRTNYNFPSKLVTGDTDGIYTHLYHGEFFDLNRESEVVAPNIPMDPVSEDWNQQAKKKFVTKYAYLRLLGEKTFSIFLWFGFLYAVLYLSLHNFKPVSLRWGIGVYVALLIVEIVAPRPRLWGRVSDKHGNPVGGIYFKLLNPKLPGVIFGSATSREDGKFFLRANPGKYELAISDKDSQELLAKFSARVGREGVYSGEFVMKEG